MPIDPLKNYRQMTTNSGTRFAAPTRSNGTQAQSDSYGQGQTYQTGYRGAPGIGQAESYRPAQHNKPEKRGFIARLVGLFRRANNRIDPEDTTEQGASASASPSTYELSLYQQRYERRELIPDLRDMVYNDPRALRSTMMFAAEAFRNGVKIHVNAEASGGASQRMLKQAEEIVKDLMELLPAPKLVSWGWMLCVEGDGFYQTVLDPRTRTVTKIVRMPTVAMERLTDDTDEFINPERAFVQLDVTTNEQIAVFPVALMHHARWHLIDGERYGNSSLIALRRTRKLLELMEEAQAVRRMTRATPRILWAIGDKDNPGEDKEIKKFRAENGFVEGKRQIFDPDETAVDFFGNGMVSMQTIPGDTGVSDIEDIKYLQDLYAAGLPTPAALFNLQAGMINRDVLEEVQKQWYKETNALCDCMRPVIRSIVDLAFLLAGIMPGVVKYDVHFSESSVEPVSDVVDRVLKMRSNATPDYQPDPILTLEKTVQLLAEFIDVDDVPAYIEALEKEKADRFKTQMDQQKQQQDMQAKMQQEQAAQQQKLQQAGAEHSADLDKDKAEHQAQLEQQANPPGSADNPVDFSKYLQPGESQADAYERLYQEAYQDALKQVAIELLKKKPNPH